MSDTMQVQTQEDKSPPASKNVNQITLASDAGGNLVTVAALCSDGTIWRIVHVGNVAEGRWSAWEKLPPLPT